MNNQRNDVLYLASQSSSRQKLLALAEIPFCLIEHTSSEELVNNTLSFGDYVQAIAHDKMRCVQLPAVYDLDREFLYVLTADTLAQVKKTGIILGKPKDREEGVRMLRLMQHEVVAVVTGCCLHKYTKKRDHWGLSAQKLWATGADALFNVDDGSIDRYFEKLPEALYGCGAGIIEGYGQLFLQSINGSYTAVLGLPLFELRKELLALGFKFK